MDEPSDIPTTNPTTDRILRATLEVLARDGSRKLSIAAVAGAAGVSRRTVYRWYPSKEALLDAFGLHEQAKFDAGLAAAISGLPEAEQLDAVLRFIVTFQRTYSLRRMVDVEPEHVLHQMTRVQPIMRDRLLVHFPGPNGATVASVVIRVALSHALLPDDDHDRFLAELRVAAGLADATTRPPRHRRRTVDRTRR